MPNYRNYPQLPAGIVRGWRDIDLTTEDYVDPDGFLVGVEGDGAVRYATLRDPATPVTDTLGAGDVPAVLGFADTLAVVVVRVYRTGTTASGLKAIYG